MENIAETIRMSQFLRKKTERELQPKTEDDLKYISEHLFSYNSSENSVEAADKLMVLLKSNSIPLDSINTENPLFTDVFTRFKDSLERIYDSEILDRYIQQVSILKNNVDTITASKFALELSIIIARHLNKIILNNNYSDSAKLDYMDEYTDVLELITEIVDNKSLKGSKRKFILRENFINSLDESEKTRILQFINNELVRVSIKNRRDSIEVHCYIPIASFYEDINIKKDDEYFESKKHTVNRYAELIKLLEKKRFIYGRYKVKIDKNKQANDFIKPVDRDNYIKYFKDDPEYLNYREENESNTDWERVIGLNDTRPSEKPVNLLDLQQRDKEEKEAKMHAAVEKREYKPEDFPDIFDDEPPDSGINQPPVPTIKTPNAQNQTVTANNPSPWLEDLVNDSVEDSPKSDVDSISNLPIVESDVDLDKFDTKSFEKTYGQLPPNTKVVKQGNYRIILLNNSEYQMDYNGIALTNISKIYLRDDGSLNRIIFKNNYEKNILGIKFRELKASFFRKNGDLKESILNLIKESELLGGKVVIYDYPNEVRAEEIGVDGLLLKPTQGNFTVRVKINNADSKIPVSKIELNKSEDLILFLEDEVEINGNETRVIHFDRDGNLVSPKRTSPTQNIDSLADLSEGYSSNQMLDYIVADGSNNQINSNILESDEGDSHENTKISEPEKPSTAIKSPEIDQDLLRLYQYILISMEPYNRLGAYFLKDKYEKAYELCLEVKTLSEKDNLNNLNATKNQTLIYERIIQIFLALNSLLEELQRLLDNGELESSMSLSTLLNKISSIAINLPFVKKQGYFGKKNPEQLIQIRLAKLDIIELSEKLKNDYIPSN